MPVPRAGTGTFLHRSAMPSRGSSARTDAGKEVSNEPDRLLTVADAAERLGTGERFIRRLIHERRIRYVKIGKYVRIAESALRAYVDERTIEPVRSTRSRHGRAA